MNRSYLRFTLQLLLAALMVIGATGCAGKNSKDRAKRLLNVSYDPTRELYREVNEKFTEKWLETTGQKLEIEQSHGGSGRQARSVIDGLEADVVTLATGADIEAIARLAGTLPENWQTRLPNNSAPYYSTMVFIVRSGNPKNIRDWDDLIRPDVQVVTPNPKTSGAARWNYLAALSWASKKYAGDDTRIQQFLCNLYANVPVLDSGARGASNTFAQTGIGDVLINWENEAFMLVEDVGEGQYEIVYPSVSILAEPPVSVVDVTAERHGVLEAAQAYLDYLYTPEAQEIAAKYHYRPRDLEVMKKYSEKFPSLDLITIDDFGGWANAQATYFADDGEFDKIMIVVQGRKK